MSSAAERLEPGTVTDAASLRVSAEPVPAEQIVAGAPVAGLVELGSLGGVEFGVWEHSVGTSTDVEADEVFVVLSGSATVTFVDSEQEPLSLSAGSVARLAAGMRTVWTVHEPLRKFYVSA
jgi:uncharacterized cupin superfamily protein